MKKIVLLFSFLFLFGHSQAQQTIGLFTNDSLAQNGYTLFAPNQFTYLIDNCGFQINRWRSVNRAGLSAYLMEDGSLLRTGGIIGYFKGAGAGGRIEIQNWEGTQEWSFDFSSEEEQQHHDIQALPNGNILLLAWEKIPMEEAIEAGRSEATSNKDVWPDKIVEIKPLGQDSAEIVWEWRAWDHLIQDLDDSKENFGVVGDHPELIDANFAAEAESGTPGVTGIDWLHSNGLSYNAERDEIVLSVRNFNEIWIIDHSTTTAEAAGHTGGKSGKGGDLLYRWGNPQAYRRGTELDQQLFKQHDPRWIPKNYPDEGMLTVFNNGNGRPGEFYSSAERLVLPLDSSGQYFLEAGEAFGPDSAALVLDWFNAERFYSGIMSGTHALPNGNQMVSVSEGGHFFELTPEGKVVWDYVNPISNNGPVSQGNVVPFQSVFRATRYPEDHPAFVGKDLSPGELLEGNPLPSDCVIYSDLEVATKAPRVLTGIEVQSNPFTDFLIIKNEQEKNIEIVVFDILGRPLFREGSRAGNWEIPSAHWTKGAYILVVKEKETNQIWRKKLIKY